MSAGEKEQEESLEKREIACEARTVIWDFLSELCALTAKLQRVPLFSLHGESGIVFSTGTDGLLEYLPWFLDKLLQPGRTLA